MKPVKRCSSGEYLRATLGLCCPFGTPKGKSSSSGRFWRVGLTVREAEEAARASGTAIGDETSVDRTDLESRLRSKLGTKVQLMGGRGSGRMVIHYYSQEELEALVDVLLGEEVVSRETT